jgi:hypothetical protein
MFKVTAKNIVSLIIAVLITFGFLWAALLSPPSILNILPYQIHESIDPGGSNEGTFIKVFDFVLIPVILLTSYILARKAFTVYNLFVEK